MTGTLNEDKHTFLIILHFILERSITFYFYQNLAVYEIKRRNIVDRGRPQMTIWHMRIAWCIPGVTNTHPGCVIFIAFPLQQWFHKYA